MKKYNDVKQKVADAIKESPVEILMGLLFFCYWVWLRENTDPVKQNFLFLFPLFVVFSFICRKIFAEGNKRLIYYLSIFLPLPFLSLDIASFVNSTGYAYSLLIAAIAVISCGWFKDNFRFAENAVRYVLDFLSGVLISYALCLAVIAIYASIAYIFNVKWMNDFEFYSYALSFTGFVSLPVAFLSFEQHRTANQFQSSKVFNVLFNFILSPAVIIYTVILYVYFAKIVIVWELPKGNVTYMVFSFILSVVIGQACQPLLKDRIYSWFYNYFSFISFPPLILFWIGICYRVNEYGFTEERIYLVLLGLLATLCMLLFLHKMMGRYLYVAFSAIALLAVFTFIPGITARQLGVQSQEKRLDGLIKQLTLRNSVSGKLHKIYADTDTLHKEAFRELYGAFNYVDNKRKSAYMIKKYGFETAEVMCQKVIPEVLNDYVKYGGDLHKSIQSDQLTCQSLNKLNITGFTRLYEVNNYNYDKLDKSYTYSFKDSILIIKDTKDKEIVKMDMNKYVKGKLAGTDINLNKKMYENALSPYRDKLLLMDLDSGRVIFGRIDLQFYGVYKVKDVQIDYFLTK